MRFSRRIVGLQTAIPRVSLKSYYRFETGIPHELCRIAHARGDAEGQSGGSSQDVVSVCVCRVCRVSMSVSCMCVMCVCLTVCGSFEPCLYVCVHACVCEWCVCM